MFFYQSNHEGDIIDAIHASRNDYDGVVINAGAYTHYSYAIRDAIEAVQDYTPFVEVHMSDIHAREDFRKTSVITDVCVKQISGFGKDSYKMGIGLLLEIPKVLQVLLVLLVKGLNRFLYYLKRLRGYLIIWV